jgi:FlaA1/EpsC-like NDP-sugar epimerase
MATAESLRVQNLVKHSANPLGFRKTLIAALQLVLIVATYYGSFLLRFDEKLDAETTHIFMITVLAVVIIKLPIFYLFGLLRGWWRYVGMSDLLDIGEASLTSAVLLYIAIVLTSAVPDYPRSVIAIDFALTVLLVGGARFAVRAYNERLQRSASLRNVIVVGAGGAGSALMQQLIRNPQLDYNPVGFVDDDSSKQGIRIHGREVLGTTDALNHLVEIYDVHSLLIAIPSASGEQIQQILRKCRQPGVQWKIFPSVAERLYGPNEVREVRPVSVDDLLGRKPVRLDVAKIREKIAGNTVLITGAAGSIGSELARQALRFHPRKLVLFDRSENDLFRLHNELMEHEHGVECTPVIGDILDVAMLRDCFAMHRPDSVFHAAAYKHVPLMEAHCLQAVTNNVFGTYNVALVAQQYQAKDFVMISSDKAVNPTNIMGVTKRVAELIILALQDGATRFSAVRFGNVLGSNGSVIPIFQEQLRKGGPLTVTHPDMKRFFMTIPEAVQLVMQASTLGKGGEIFVLDMGEPIKIVELAKNLIRISGAERKIDIVFTGIRPGEKLFEELQFQSEGLKPTAHEKIRVLDGGKIEFAEMQQWLDELSLTIDTRNVSRVIQQLRTVVPEYCPSAQVLSLCDVDRHDVSARYRLLRQSLTPKEQRQSA